MRGGFLVDPVFLFIGHAVATGNLSGGTGLIAGTGQRPVAEGFRPVAPSVRIPSAEWVTNVPCVINIGVVSFLIVGSRQYTTGILIVRGPSLRAIRAMTALIAPSISLRVCSAASASIKRTTRVSPS